MIGLVELRAQGVSAVVSAGDGGRITSLVVAGTEILGGAGRGVVEHGSFVMAPWAGRIRDGELRAGGMTHRLPTDRTHPHAGHGLVMDRPWEVVESTADAVRLRCPLDARWPWAGHVDQSIALRGDRIEQSVQVHAAQAEFPATIGWHPWFVREPVPGIRGELALSVAGMLRRDPAGIPDGTVVAVPPGPWDDCFTGVRWPIVITWPGLLELRITSDATFAVIFDERSEAFCVEPQTGPPDGPNTAPVMASPGAPVVASTTWSWRVL